MKRYLFFILAAVLFFLAPRAHAAPAFVQATTTGAFVSGGCGSTQCGINFDSSVTSGNLIIVWGTWGTSSGSMSATDNRGDTFTCPSTSKGADGTNGQSSQICYALNVTGGTTHVTTTFPSSAWTTEMILEYSGVGSYETSTAKVANGTTGTNNVNSGTRTTANADLIVGTVADDASTGSFTSGTGQTNRLNVSSAQAINAEDYIQGAAGVASSTWTLSKADRYIANMIAFTAANSSPNAPSEDAPANAAQDASTTPVFKMTATDPEGNSLQYKVVVYTNSGCTATSTTYDQSASQTGWSGQNASSSQEYTSGTQGVFTSTSTLSTNTTYYWKASAKDPEGSNKWTAAASCNSFTTTYGNWTTDSGSWSISSNALTVTPASGASVQLHVTGVSQANGVVEFKVKSSGVGAGSGNLAGIARADTGANRYHLTMADFLNQQEVIGSTISSAYSALVTTAFTFSSATYYEMRGYASGTSLKSWLNGGNALTKTDSSLVSAGYFGIAASSTNGTAAFTIDNFAVYSSPTITMNSLPSGGSWSVRDHSGTVISCQTGSTWDISTYSGQVPIDYDNGGGTVAVWTNNTCNGSPDQVYPSAGLSTSIFGGDTYLYTASIPGDPGASGGAVIATSSVTVNTTGAVSY